jgi:hypothetical protein
MNEIDAQMAAKSHTEDYNKFMQDMGAMIDRIVLSMKGMRFVINDQGQYATEVYGKPLCNDGEINYVENKLRSYLNPNLYMSQLTPPEAKKNYRIEVDRFGMTLLQNMAVFNLEPLGLNKIISLVCPVIYHALMKSTSDKGFIQTISKVGYVNASRDEPVQRPV